MRSFVKLGFWELNIIYPLFREVEEAKILTIYTGKLSLNLIRAAWTQLTSNRLVAVNRNSQPLFQAGKSWNAKSPGPALRAETAGRNGKKPDEVSNLMELGEL